MGRLRARRRGRLWLALLLVVAGVLGLVALTGCGRPAAADVTTGRVRQLLDRRARDLLGRDEEAFVATGGQGVDAAAAERARTWFRNLAQVPLASVSYRVTACHHHGDTATVDAELRYRLDGYDRAPVVAPRTLDLRRHDGRWYVAEDRPAGGAIEQLWDQGPVGVVRGTYGLVLGVGQDRARLRHFAALADHAVPAVGKAWGPNWSRRVVVEVPGSLAAMARLLGSPASGYRGIAAVTTGEAGGPARAPADRVVINPEAYGVLGDFGQQVVLTHETTHVATRTATTAATPLWLSEGYADWVGYRGTGRTAAQAAPELQQAILAGRVPAELPDDDAFGFSRAADPLAEAYEGGWLACRMIAERWGEDRLESFYRAVGAHRTRAGAVDGALRKVLGLSLRAFTEQWREYLRANLR